MKAATDKSTIPSRPIERHIYTIRGQKVMLDADLAALFRVPTSAFNQAVRRNSARFPEDFMFQLSEEEAESLRSQFVTSNQGRGGRRYIPYVFTEHGVAMLAGVLRSDVAVAMSIAIVRAFVRMREIITTNKDIAARIGKLEYANDHAASVIEDLARDIANLAEEVEQMKIIPPPTKRKIGFCIDED